MLEEYQRGLSQKVFALTADGGSNAQKALRGFEGSFGLWCFCHLLHLCVRAAMKVNHPSELRVCDPYWLAC